MPAEYGNQELQPHVIDNADSAKTPARMTNFGANYGYCTGDMITTNGDILIGESQMFEQKSCTPDTGNVGNYYDWVAAIATNYDEHSSSLDTKYYIAPDSICPRGWQLPNGDKGLNLQAEKTFAAITFAYLGISENTDTDSTYVQKLQKGPMSYIKAGESSYSSGMPKGSRNNYIYLWSNQVGAYATQASTLSARDIYIFPNTTMQKGYGMSLRCVAR